jgi:hypothetical protein
MTISEKIILRTHLKADLVDAVDIVAVAEEAKTNIMTRDYQRSQVYLRGGRAAATTRTSPGPLAGGCALDNFHGDTRTNVKIYVRMGSDSSGFFWESCKPD